MATIYQKFGQKVRSLRREQKLSQEELAGKARIDPKSIIEIESGKRNPTLKTISEIARAFKISLPDLFRF